MFEKWRLVHRLDKNIKRGVRIHTLEVVKGLHQYDVVLTYQFCVASLNNDITAPIIDKDPVKRINSCQTRAF